MTVGQSELKRGGKVKTNSRLTVDVPDGSRRDDIHYGSRVHNQPLCPLAANSDATSLRGWDDESVVLRRDSAVAPDSGLTVGSIATMDSVAVAGSVATAGSVAVAASVATAGSVAVVGSAATAGSVAVAGSAGTAGSFGVVASLLTVLSLLVRECVACIACTRCIGCVACVRCVDCVGVSVA